jgi:PAS domain-containing protein
VTSISFVANKPLKLHHSWPLFEQSRHFELGLVLSSAVTDAIDPSEVGGLGIHHAGCWECDLSNDSLTWSGGVHDIFGLPRRVRVTRQEALSLYSERSRAAMEQLRAYAIRYKRGFTLDIELRPVIGGSQWARLIAAPVCEDDRVVRLHGLKLVI